MLFLKGLVDLHRIVQLLLLQRYRLGHRLELRWYWMLCRGNEQRSFCCFWDCIQVLHFRLFCWPWWLLHFFWGIPARSSRYKPVPVHLSSLIPRMLTFTLAISCLTTSDLPWFMDLTFQVPMQYCSLQHGTLLYHQSHPQLGVVFTLALSLHSFLSYFSTDLQKHKGIYWPGEFIFQCHIFLPFHTVHGALKARILKWFAIPFSSGPHFSELSTMTRLSWVALHGMA